MSRLRWLVVLLWALVAGPAAGEPVVLAPELKSGDAFGLVLRKTRERVDSGRLVFRGRAETPIDVRVEEAGGDGALIDWTFGETRVLEPANSPPPPDAALFRGVTLRFRLDPTGRPRTIENYPEVRQRLEASMNLLLGSILDPALRDRLGIFLREAYGGKEQVEQMLLSEIAYYFVPFSVPLEPSRPTRRDVELPSPVNGKPLRATDELTLVRYEPRAAEAAAQLAVIEWTQTMDAAESARMMRELEQRLRERAHSQPGTSQPALPPRVEQRIDGRFEVPLTGVRAPKTAEVTRRSIAGNTLLTDILRYERTR
jgi:hypothetical protein